MLAKVPDPRKNKGKRHPLKSILALIVIGLMCGHKGYTSIAKWARSQKALTKAIGFTHKKTPCPATFHNLLKKLDVVALEDTLTEWVNEVIQSRPDLTSCGVSIDGKTLRASSKAGATIKHLLSVVSHELGVTLTQRSVDDKTNEIPISTEILKAFDVKGKVVTTDALLTQRDFCKQVVHGGGDYLQPVKENQEFLLWAIEKVFELETPTLSDEAMDEALRTRHRLLGKTFDIYQTSDNDHGRLETRCLKTSTALNEYIDWPHVAQVFEYRYSYKSGHTGEETHKIQYGITSLDPSEADAKRLLRLRRGHWTIENKVHWVRDNVFGEDASPVRSAAIPQVMAAMRNTAMSVLRFTGHTKITDATHFYASKPKLAVNLIK